MFALALFALAQAAPAAAQPATQVAPAAANVDPEVEALRQRLLTAQQTIATLERQLATAKDRAVLADQCRIKNGRLVFIAREVIEAYGRRFHDEHHDPIELGRRRFEFELQALSDAVYDARAEVPVKVPGDTAAQPAPKAAPAPASTPAPANAAGH